MSARTSDRPAGRLRCASWSWTAPRSARNPIGAALGGPCFWRARPSVRSEARLSRVDTRGGIRLARGSLRRAECFALSVERGRLQGRWPVSLPSQDTTRLACRSEDVKRPDACKRNLARAKLALRHSASPRTAVAAAATSVSALSLVRAMGAGYCRSRLASTSASPRLRPDRQGGRIHDEARLRHPAAPLTEGIASPSVSRLSREASVWYLRGSPLSSLATARTAWLSR